MGRMPVPPRDLKDEALKEWKRIAPLLEADGKVTHLDQMMIAGYCRAMAMATEAANLVDADGVLVKGERGKVKNPALQVFRDCMSTATAAAKPLGITPEGRAKLKVEDNAPPDASTAGDFND